MVLHENIMGVVAVEVALPCPTLGGAVTFLIPREKPREKMTDNTTQRITRFIILENDKGYTAMRINAYQEAIDKQAEQARASGNYNSVTVTQEVLK